MLEALREVVELRDQWPTVAYQKDGGGTGTHTFDFWARLSSGLRVAVAVKPARRVETSGLLRTIELVRQQGVLRPFADATLIITDTDVNRGPERNARRILRARRMRNEAEVEAARAALAGVHGWVRFADLLKGFPIQAHRRNALWCLIDEGFLVPRNGEEISDSTWVRVAPARTDAA